MQEREKPTDSEPISQPDTIPVPANAIGERLDKFLGQLRPVYSRAFVQKCIFEHHVLLNGRETRPSRRLQEGDIIAIQWPPPEDTKLEPEPVDFDIIFEDQDILVVNKPSGVVVHPTRNEKNGTLVHGLLYYDPDIFSEMLDHELRPGIVHRLDKETSGAMVVAKNIQSWNYLKSAFRQRTVEKVYLAIVIGEFGTSTGQIENLIGRHPRDRKRMAVVEANGKPAITRYRVLAGSEGATLLEVHIETGRTHQIRVHFANLHHPVLGDRVYGGRRKLAVAEPERQMLHSWRLTVPHPRTGALCEYKAPIPEDFNYVMKQLNMA